jgi:hypothetical protein
MDARRALPMAAVLLLLAACSGGSESSRPHPTVRPSASPSAAGCPAVVCRALRVSSHAAQSCPRSAAADEGQDEQM